MTKEQEKAIERCNKLIETEHSNWIGISNQKAIETVLNMLKEKDNIIEGKECVIETQAHNEEVLLNTLKKKDKMIDYLLRACLHSIVSGEKFTLEINNRKYEDKDIDVRIEQLRKFVAEKAE